MLILHSELLVYQRIPMNLETHLKTFGVSIVMGVPRIAGWFKRENPMKMDDLGAPPISENI